MAHPGSQQTLEVRLSLRTKCETGQHETVAAAAELAPQIRLCRDELESARRMPQTLVQGLADAGMLDMFLPRSMGGPELDPITGFQAVEEVSKVDGSVGWCSAISAGGSVFMGWLRAEIGEALLGHPPDFRLAGSIRPEGQARVVPGGYRMRGRWSFGSGIDHANLLACACTVENDYGPLQTEGGAPQTRVLLLPAEAAIVHDTWSVVGMAGTGSHDFSVEERFVPEEHTLSLSDPPLEEGPLYHPRLVMVIVWTPYVANLLGMARGAMNAFIDLASDTSSSNSGLPLRDRTLVQATVGEAEGIISAARAYAIDAIGQAWQAACRGEPDPAQEVAQARLAIVHSAREAVKAVDLLFNAAGTNAIFRKHPLERFFRDIHVAVQHVAAQPIHLQSAGKVMLGLRPAAFGW